MKNKPVWLVMFVFSATLALSGCGRQDSARESAATAADPEATTAQRANYSPYADQPPEATAPPASDGGPTRVFWGDQHLHTSWSGDAAPAGTRVTPDEALRLAQGEQIVSSTGQKVKLSRALDWIVVSDHSDAMGLAAGVISGDAELMKDPVIEEWNRQINAGGDEAMKAVMDIIKRQSTGTLPAAMLDQDKMFDNWRQFTGIIEARNRPGTFTAFIGYEWTSNASGGNNLHRNVIYRDGKEMADRLRPLTTFDSEDPAKLWAWMSDYESRTGGKVLAIPHNGNLSNGRMFEVQTFDGKPLTGSWAVARAKWEPLYEITQGKGTSEQHPSLAPADEFASFEIWDKGNLNVVPKTPGMIKTEYAREALKSGLVLAPKLGANPFQFGFAGGTDAHTGLATTDENSFFGKFPASEPSPERWNENAFEQDGRIIKAWMLGASGLTAVWARENTREALWDAMKRRETYATTGSRPLVRFFGGWSFAPDDVSASDIGRVGYEKGVAMGDILARNPGSGAPSFLVAAMKDPLSANLDRIQIVKGWVDGSGNAQEKVFDVAWSEQEGRRKRDADGKVPSVGSTVDVANVSWTDTIGAPSLYAVWQDPEFDRKARAFYYARVIEIPTPRWTAYDAKFFGVKMTDEVPMQLQERAYTSPIWYEPARR